MSHDIETFASDLLDQQKRVGLLVDPPADLQRRYQVIASDPQLVIFKHPRLWDLFVQATIDNVLDRLLRNGTRERPGAVSRRRDEAAGGV